MLSEPGRGFVKRLTALERTRLKLESAEAASILSATDSGALYEAVFMRAFTSLESFFEELFFAVVLGNTQHPRGRALPRSTFKSHRVLREFVLGDRDYVDWVPFGRVEQRARVFLRGGRPFTDLPPAQQQRVRQWHATRNAIAHPGTHARRQFERQVVAQLPLLARERTPAGFLRSEAQPGRRRLEFILREMSQIARLIG
jgi:hypothetical protein